jgi:hypothetical protein
MAHDAFISCSQQDKRVAEAACSILESSGIRCWVAPRDVPPGSQWAGSIVEAIDRCRVMILIFLSKANVSDQVHRELEQAVRRGKPIFALRIEDVSPVGSMDYFLSAVHWLDALTPPIEKHLNELARAVRFHLDGRQNGANPSRPDAQRQANVHPNATRANWVPVARNWAAPLAIFIGLAVGGVGTALYVMSEIGFVGVEHWSRAPMLPLTLFRSRTFSAVNLLTLLLYAALGGVLFFLPFALIQVHGYPATLAGAAFLPFTIIMAALSRWAGGLLDRVPLVVGPAIAAAGIGLMAVTVANGSYWQFLVSIVILGFGMVVSVAPLTTTVINAVPAHQVGVASGINNAVSSVANLFAVAVLGGVAVATLDHALDRHLQSGGLSEAAKHSIQAARGQLVIEPALANIQGADRPIAELILKGSLAESIRSVMLVAAILALGAAAAGSLVPRSTEVHRDQ